MSKKLTDKQREGMIDRFWAWIDPSYASLQRQMEAALWELSDEAFVRFMKRTRDDDEVEGLGAGFGRR